MLELVARSDLAKRFSSTVRNALVQKDFYTTKFDAGRDPEVETMFAEQIEGPAARALRKIIDEHRSTTFPALRR